jgi:hypothetical protein
MALHKNLLTRASINRIPAVAAILANYYTLSLFNFRTSSTQLKYQYSHSYRCNISWDPMAQTVVIILNSLYDIGGLFVSAWHC